MKIVICFKNKPRNCNCHENYNIPPYTSQTGDHPLVQILVNAPDSLNALSPQPAHHLPYPPIACCLNLKLKSLLSELFCAIFETLGAIKF